MGFSPMFERNKPVVSLSHQGYWNFQEPIRVSVEDASGIKSFKATISTDHDDWVVLDDTAASKEKKREFEILPPKGHKSVESQSVVLKIEATDNSLWGLFMVNTFKQ
jgi:hypothetical protein